jgi:hypothetical protein
LDEEYLLWDKPQDWPLETPGYVFLARACQEVGRRLFGCEWNESFSQLDDALEALEPPDEPDDLNDETVDTVWDQYEAACDDAERNFKLSRNKVVESLSEAFRLGEIMTAVRAVAGGHLAELESNFWNSELTGISVRFERCKMSLSDPFNVRLQSHFIFVGLESLDRWLQKYPIGGGLNNTAGVTGSSRSNRQPRAHRLDATMHALLTLYPDGLPNGLMEGKCLESVNKFLGDQQLQAVSAATLRRAKLALWRKRPAERK